MMRNLVAIAFLMFGTASTRVHGALDILVQIPTQYAEVRIDDVVKTATSQERVASAFLSTDELSVEAIASSIWMINLDGIRWGKPNQGALVTVPDSGLLVQTWLRVPPFDATASAYAFASTQTEIHLQVTDTPAIINSIRPGMPFELVRSRDQSVVMTEVTPREQRIELEPGEYVLHAHESLELTSPPGYQNWKTREPILELGYEITPEPQSVLAWIGLIVAAAVAHRWCPFYL